MKNLTIPSEWNVPRGTGERLAKFQILLEQWQSKINLIGDAQDIWNRHIIDSLQLLPHVPKDSTIVDIGSGAGLPGLVLAAADAGRVHLVESDKRKCQFLYEAARIMDINVIIHNDRIENIFVTNVDIVTSRACASVIELLSLTHHLLLPDTRYVLLKGTQAGDEVATAHQAWRFSSESMPSCTHPQGHILVLSEVHPL